LKTRLAYLFYAQRISYAVGLVIVLKSRQRDAFIGFQEVTREEEVEEYALEFSKKVNSQDNLRYYEAEYEEVFNNQV